MNTRMKNKLLFWQTSDWFNYNLGYSLQNYNFKIYSIIDTVRKPKKFFEHQKFVNYEKIWFFHDVIKKKIQYDLDYLEKFESKYKIDLWLLAVNERIFYKFNPFYKFSTDEILSIIEQECKFFESVIDEINPDYLIISLTWQHQAELLRLICKAKGIRILMINTSELGGGTMNWTISEEFGINDFEKENNLEKEHNLENSKITFEELRNYLEKWKNNANIKKISGDVEAEKKSQRFLAGLSVLSSNNVNEKTHFSYYGRSKSKLIKTELIEEINTKKRKSFIDKNFQKTFNKNEKFIFFPLHQEQERALLISAPFFTNQIETIRHVVKSMPIGYKLFVKEHPVMKLRGWREISEYQEIMNIPNVLMIHPEVESLKLIKDCNLVISINSTACFESLFYNKPSINFQRRGYSEITSSFVVGELNDLPKLIRHALKIQVNPSEIYNYIQKISENLFNFDYLGFKKSYDKILHANGNLVDITIHDEDMKKFLDMHKKEFDNLSLEYIKKINQHEQNCKRSIS